MKFIDVLHRGRERKPNAALQERIAAYTLFRPSRNVTAAPVTPPLREDKRV